MAMYVLCVVGIGSRAAVVILVTVIWNAQVTQMCLKRAKNHVSLSPALDESNSFILGAL